MSSLPISGKGINYSRSGYAPHAGKPIIARCAYPNPCLCFVFSQLRLRHKDFFPSSARNCIDLFYLLLPYASSYLSCKWKWDPKLQQMGPCHWMQMFPLFCGEYTCPIKLTLTPLSWKQTSLLKAPLPPNLFTVWPSRTTVSHRGLNNLWLY